MSDVGIDACYGAHIGIMVVMVAFAVVGHVICIRSVPVRLEITAYCLRPLVT